MAGPFQAVIFDFDYTLADSSAGVEECVRYALAQMGLPPVAPESVQRTIGLSLAETFATLTGQPSGAEAFVRLFVERAEVVMNERTRLLPAVPETIAWLQAQGLALGIVSTKFRRRIEERLRWAGLRDAFAVIVGGEDVARHKPDPEGLQCAMAALEILPAAVLYVGDSLTDAQTAVRAGVTFCAVLTGVTPADAFSAYPVYRVIQDLSELRHEILEKGQSNGDGTQVRM